MSDFRNGPVSVDSLPQLDDQAFVPVDRRYLRMSLWGIAISAVLVLLAGVVITAVVPRNRWIPLVAMLAVLLLLGAIAALKVLEVRHIAFQIRDHDLSYRRGVLIKSVSTVPFVRVQHARIRRGPIERRFGLATLEVNSAGPDLRIEGLTNDDAERLKALVVERAGDLVEDAN